MTVDVAANTAVAQQIWTQVCLLDDLASERGAAALVGGEQVALFRTHADEVYAVQQLDPFSGAYVMSRGLVGTRGETPTVASPMFKQVFDLRTGACLESVGREPLPLRVWAIRVHGGRVQVGQVGQVEPAATEGHEG